jgi:hypothetical protein
MASLTPATMGGKGTFNENIKFKSSVEEPLRKVITVRWDNWHFSQGFIQNTENVETQFWKRGKIAISVSLNAISFENNEIHEMILIKWRSTDFVQNSHIQRCCCQRDTAIRLAVTLEGADNFIFSSAWITNWLTEENTLINPAAVKQWKERLLKTVGYDPKDI